ncbi:cytochrome P450 [Nocardioides marinquilinus]|uniref:Cytochrome P450 n=1 Tax=Nocardioides marinquilinus TaxID=1210400 RepID=A0ABP9Q1Y3_9ACTN
MGAIRRRVSTMLLERTMRDGLDLRKLRFFPEALQVPFKRVGVVPAPELTALREREPVTKLATLFGKNIWLVTGAAEVRAALADGASYSNDIGQFVSQEGKSDEEQIGGLGMTDPPLHTALRRYLTPEFTMRRIARLEPVIERIVHERLDAMEDAGPEVDLVSQFAFPVPFEVICELLGLPTDERERFYEIGVARFDLTQGGAGAFGAAVPSREFLIKAVAAQREHPGDGLIGGLLKEHGDELSDLVLGGIADGVFLGGYETSASMLALGAYLLSQHPEAMAIMREDDADAAAVDRVVEELLRHLTVVQLAFLRFAKVDLELGGQQVKAGDPVAFSLLAANHDPELAGADPDAFDPHREPTRHLAFGHGMHRCVGAELARMELRIALRALARRFPDLTVAAETSDLDFRKLSAVYGVEALPVLLHGPDRAGARV